MDAIKLTPLRECDGWFKTDFVCPSSSETNVHHLNARQDGEMWLAWCGNKECKSGVTNDGGYGTTVKMACAIVELLVKCETKSKTTRDSYYE